MKAGISVPRSSRRSSSGRMSGASTRNACRKDRGAAATSASSNLSSAVSSSPAASASAVSSKPTSTKARGCSIDTMSRRRARTPCLSSSCSSSRATPSITGPGFTDPSSSSIARARRGSPRRARRVASASIDRARRGSGNPFLPISVMLARRPDRARSGYPPTSRRAARTSAASSWTCGSAAWASTSATRLSHASTPARTSRSSATRAMVR